MEDTAGAFIKLFDVAGATDGPLAGLTFGAKDLFDIAGHMTGCGSPDWALSHDIAAVTAPAVSALLAAGASLVGKTHSDEIAYSLMGVNAHYGTPLNSAAPDRVPGGSSSGSVAAVAATLVDFALGSDTGGSVRMPASFCGVYGIRVTHGAVDLSDAMPFAPSFDTAGWFARDAALFARIGTAYGLAPAIDPQPRLLLADDAFERATPATRAALAPSLAVLQQLFGSAQPMQLSDGAYEVWRDCFRIIQAGEIWQTHGDWITATQPAFGPGIKQRFEMAAGITAPEFKASNDTRLGIRQRLDAVLAEDGIVVLPTSPGPAPLKAADERALDSFRTAALELLCPAGLAGLPQVSIPTGKVDGGPVGLSLVGPRGSDGVLLAMAAALQAAEADLAE